MMEGGGAMEGGRAHLGLSLPMSVHIHARSSSFVLVCFHLWAVAFICGQWHLFVGSGICLYAFTFICGWSCLFMGAVMLVHGQAHSFFWAVMPLAMCGGGLLVGGGGGWSSWRFMV